MEYTPNKDIIKHLKPPKTYVTTTYRNKKEIKELELEYALIRQIIKTRVEQKVSQKA